MMQPELSQRMVYEFDRYTYFIDKLPKYFSRLSIGNSLPLLLRCERDVQIAMRGIVTRTTRVNKTKGRCALLPILGTITASSKRISSKDTRRSLKNQARAFGLALGRDLLRHPEHPIRIYGDNSMTGTLLSKQGRRQPLKPLSEAEINERSGNTIALYCYTKF